MGENSALMIITGRRGKGGCQGPNQSTVSVYRVFKPLKAVHCTLSTGSLDFLANGQTNRRHYFRHRDHQNYYYFHHRKHNFHYQNQFEFDFVLRAKMLFLAAGKKDHLARLGEGGGCLSLGTTSIKK